MFLKNKQTRGRPELLPRLRIFHPFPNDAVNVLFSFSSSSLKRLSLSSAQNRWGNKLYVSRLKTTLKGCFGIMQSSQDNSFFSAHSAVEVIPEWTSARLQKGTHRGLQQATLPFCDALLSFSSFLQGHLPFSPWISSLRHSPPVPTLTPPPPILITPPHPPPAFRISLYA